jgi:hypothetical protein
MHTSIYKKLGKANTIVHTHSPYTLGTAMSVIDKFQHIIEEAKIVVGNPVIISNEPSCSADLANLVSKAFAHGGEDLRVVIIENHGVVAVGKRSSTYYYHPTRQNRRTIHHSDSAQLVKACCVNNYEQVIIHVCSLTWIQKCLSICCIPWKHGSYYRIKQLLGIAA